MVSPSAPPAALLADPPLARWPYLSVMAAAAVLVALAYIVLADPVWNDYHLDLATAKNLAAGRGMTFTPAEPSYSFTSPLTALLLASGGGLMAVRAVNIAALAAAVVLLTAVSAKRGWAGTAALVALAALTLLEPKGVLFAVSGGAGGLMLLGVAGMVTAAACGAASRRSWVWFAVAGALAMWSRADGWVLMLLVAVAAGLADRRLWATVGKGVAAAVVLQLPWLIAAWVQYGTVLPLPVVAGWGGHEEGAGPGTVIAFLTRWPGAALGQSVAVFAPVEAWRGGWPGWTPWYAGLLAVVAASGCVRPRLGTFGRIGAMGFVLGVLYLGAVKVLAGQVAPWLYPPVAVCGFVAVAAALHALTGQLQRMPRPALATGTLAAALGICMAALGAMSLAQQGVFHKEIERGVRQHVAQWISENIPVDSTVFLAQPYGRIAAACPGTVLDWPGSVSPAMVQMRHKRPVDMMGAIVAIRPDWLVLRNQDLVKAQVIDDIRANYTLAHALDGQPSIQTYDRLPGQPWLRQHMKLFVLQHTPGQGPAPGISQVPSEAQGPTDEPKPTP